MVIVYGIPNCDTVKKAKDWLTKNNIEYEFHNYKKDGIKSAKLKQWIAVSALELVLNKKGTTWKMLDEDLKKMANNSTKAIELMKEKTSLIKRPIVEIGNTILIGFTEDDYTKAFIL